MMPSLCSNTPTAHAAVYRALFSLMILCVATKATSIAFDSAMQQVQQCQGMALGRQTTQGCLKSIDSSFNVLMAAVTGMAVTQVSLASMGDHATRPSHLDRRHLERSQTHAPVYPRLQCAWTT